MTRRSTPSADPKKLFVGNLPQDVSEPDLRDIFEEHGTVVGANVVIDRFTQLSRGFGFVVMSTPQEATAAQQAVNGIMIEEASIFVDHAKPPKKKFDPNKDSAQTPATTNPASSSPSRRRGLGVSRGRVYPKGKPQPAS